MRRPDFSFLRVFPLAGTLCAGLLGAAALHAQSRPALRMLGPVVATSKDSLGAVSNVRALPGGKLLINDAASRRVILVDSNFTLLSVVADSTPSTANAYGPRSGSLIAYRGDSTLFVDAASLSMLVIDPQGKIGRVMSVPRAQDAMMLSNGLGAFYSNGHLVYRGMPNMQMRTTGGASITSGAMPQVVTPDSMAIVRVNLQTRVLDTVGHVKIPRTNPVISRQDDKISVSIEVNPLPTVDEWVVTSTGDVALIRGQDYHVDWMSADGQRRSSPKIAFDWKRLTDEEKTQFVDSVSKIFEKQYAAGAAGGQALQQGFQQVFGGGGGGAAVPQVTMRFEVNSSGSPGGPTRAPQMTQPKLTVVSPSQLPDYQPPFFSTSARPDADGNIWVRTIPTKPQPAGSAYDVINAKGEAIDRVLIPENRTIIGFGPGGVVYMTFRDGNQTRLERSRIR
jgi:hypothetical protein